MESVSHMENSTNEHVSVLNIVSARLKPPIKRSAEMLTVSTLLQAAAELMLMHVRAVQLHTAEQASAGRSHFGSWSSDL